MWYTEESGKQPAFAALISGRDRQRWSLLVFLLNLSRYLYKIKICDIISRYLTNIGGTEYEGSL